MGNDLSGKPVASEVGEWGLGHQSPISSRFKQAVKATPPPQLLWPTFAPPISGLPAQILSAGGRQQYAYRTIVIEIGMAETLIQPPH
jgi:hypothetical protein